MNKVFVLAPREDWIVDRFVFEWNKDNADVSVAKPADADVIWLLSDWCWRHVPLHVLMKKKIITTIHHIVPEKFDDRALAEFIERDAVTSCYHVPNTRTEKFIRSFTKKPIYVIAYWANQDIWRPTGTRSELRKKHGLPTDAYLVGSFQRDTEGHDQRSPKLEKGPDLLADALTKLNESHHNIHVVLAGWRRQYIMMRLDAAKISYTYFERPAQDVLNELYQTLDLYPVTARHEGGPQSLIEAGLLNVPVVSRPVGMAECVLPAHSIHEDVTLATPTVPNVKPLMLPVGYEPYRKLIQSL